MHRGCFVWTPTPPLLGRRTPRPGPARVRVCVPCLAGSGGPASRARFGAPHLFPWPVLVRSLFARPPPGWGCPFCLCAPPLFPAFRVFRPGVPWALASCCPPFPHPPPFFFPCSSFALCCFFLSRPHCLPLFVFSGPGCLGPWRLVSPPPRFFFPSCLLFSFLFSAFPLFLGFFFFFAGCAVRGGFCVLGCRVCRCVVRWCCPCRCSLCGSLSPLWRWLVLCGVACPVRVFAVGPGCPLSSPGGSWCRVSVVLSLSGRVARRPVVWCGVSWCFAALCCVLWCCAVVWWCAVVLCCLFALLPVPVVCFLPLRVCCVCSGVSCCAFPVLSALSGAFQRCAGALALCCPRRLCCFWCLVLLVFGVAACFWGSAGGSGCLALSFGGVWRLWCQCLAWPSFGVFPVVSCSPVLCPVALCCRVVLCCGALSSFSFFLFFFCLAAGAGCLFPFQNFLQNPSKSFSAFENKLRLYPTQPTREQQDHMLLSDLRFTRRPPWRRC